MKKHILSTLAILLLSLSFPFARAQSAELVVGLSSAPSNLSPFFATDANSQNINRLLYLTLTDFGRDMDFVCRACVSYEEKFVGPKHVLKFKLKTDLKFWDGTPVTAHDVINSWKIFSDEEKPKSIFRFAFKKIESFKAHNDYELELVYPSYSADNISDLALLKILKVKSGASDFAVENLIGSGPYKLHSSSSLGVVITPAFNANKDSINFKVVKDETTLALKMMNKEIDLSVAQLSPRKIDWIENNVDHLDIIGERGTNYIYVGINHRNKHLGKKEFRQALDLMIPREKLVKYKMKDTAVLANGLFSPSFTGLYDSGLAMSEYNPQKAKELLASIGYKWVNGILSFDNVPVTLDWKISNNKAAEEIVDAISDEFNQNGITMQKTVQEWGTFMHSMKTGQFDLVMSQWVGFTGPGMLSYVFASQSFPPAGANRGYFENKQLDQLLEAASGPMTKEQRLINYRQANAIAVNDRAYLSLWHPDIIWIARNCLKGVSPYPNGNFLPLLEIQSSACHGHKWEQLLFHYRLSRR